MITRILSLVLIFSAVTSAIAAERPSPPAPAKVAIEPLDLRWTFGNHEPISMYRRTGRKSTGGIEGGSHWLKDWHHWYDSQQCPATMEQLGLNILHGRFYKGMGWKFESRDFPRVKQFVRNCHKHNVKALAYVQFSTLYYETMLAEVPDLADWVAVDQNGRKLTYHGDAYYRWLPCINAPGFEPYLKKVIRIALEEGDFDGIMFDNCVMPKCYCDRCTKRFREHLRSVPNPEDRFGIPTVDHVLPPVWSKFGEIKDPIYQQWIKFRCQQLTSLFGRLFVFGKSCKPSAIMTGNIAHIRGANVAGSGSKDIVALSGCFDMILAQSGNEPGISRGCIVNRVRAMKLAQALQMPILVLSDSDAGISGKAESKYVLNLMENAIFGGIPTDRTVMKPDRRDMVSPRLIGFRKPLLKRFDDTIRTERAAFEAPVCAPVRLLYSNESIMFSEESYRSILNAEEILLRNHIPWGLLPCDAEKGINIPEDCQVLLVSNQACLSDGQLKTLIEFAERGGRLIVTGRSGECDEWYRQRRENPLACLDNRPNVVRRAEADEPRILQSGWTIKVQPPKDGGRRLLGELDELWKPAIRITGSDTVFAEIKRGEQGFFVHLLNYAEAPVAKGTRVELRTDGAPQCSFATPMAGQPAKPLPVERKADGRSVVVLPEFKDYALISLQMRDK